MSELYDDAELPQLPFDEKRSDEIAEASNHKPSPSFEEISKFRLAIFVFLMILSQLMAQAILAQTVVPFNYIAESVGVENDAGEISWFSASFSLTFGSFILIAGQLGDLFGYKLMYCLGYLWMSALSLVCGCTAYVKNPIFFDVIRALQGIGPAICVPNSLALLGHYFPHGSTIKNLAMAAFGGIAPAGFVLGATFASLLSQLAWWPWMFWITAILSFTVVILGFVFIPHGISNDASDENFSITDKWKEFDYLGSITGLTGLVLVNFSWNQGPVVGWQKVYVYVLLIVGLLAIGAFFYLELHFVKRPLLPREVLTGETGLVLACIGAGWSCFGIWIYYTHQFGELILNETPLLMSAQFTPAIISGFIASGLTGLLFKKVSTSLMMIIAMLAFTVASILMATRHVHQTYWAQKFPSIIIGPFGMDISFPAATMVLSHNLSKKHQGVAASAVATSVNYSISIGLGIAGTVQRYIDPTSTHTLEGIRAAFYVGIGLAGLGVCVATLFLIKQRTLKSTF